LATFLLKGVLGVAESINN